MAKQPPTQIEPLLDPNQPTSENRHPYYLLEKMHSPPIAPPNSIRWSAYDSPHDLGDTLAYGFIEYQDKVSWADLERYNMRPFDYDEGVLYRMYRGFDNDKRALLAYLTSFYQLTEGDHELNRLALAIKLVGRDWDLKKVRKMISGIEG